jgi:hypothetical protein
MIKESDDRVQDRAAVIAHPLDHMIKESDSKIKRESELKEEERLNDEFRG